MIRFLMILSGAFGVVACASGAGGRDASESTTPAVDLEHRLVVKLVSAPSTGSAEEGTLRADGPVVSPAIEGLVANAGLDLRPLLPGVDELFERSHGITPAFDFSSVLATDVLDHDALLALANALEKLPEVEFAYVQPLAVPPPADIAPPSTNFTNQQGYRNTGTNGVGATYASSIGLTGQGVRISDCEYGWNLAHEDLVDQGVVPEPNQTSPAWVATNGWDSHGTAVLGELGATSNAYG
ncbi:MAG: hypothetical protein AAF211_28185, partial [Myxococcota bacterium]